MEVIVKVLVTLLVVAAGAAAATYDSINRDVINKKVDRKLDISSQLLKITNKITLENGGSGAVRSFLLAFTRQEKENLSYLNAQVAQSSSLEKLVFRSIGILNSTRWS
ncbi:hypothetical protein OTU49_016611 [Cherax quadricarinatus]|uniref:Dolichyl-diphosphooligosaccharide--protein glycosyltransferase subunit 1 n=1 Tax=Cherax quadricarinatus TaxID=27406 RepID=A0AAW0XTT9_CHEQU